MKRNIVFTNLVVLSLSSVACDFIADFKKDESSAAGADSGGKSNRGGAANNGGNAGKASSGGTTASVAGGSTSTTSTSSGGIAGTDTTTTTTSSGGTAGTGTQTTTTTAQGGTSLGGATSGGTTSGGTTLGGATTGGSTSGGTTTTGVGGVASPGGATNGGATAKGGTSSVGGTTASGGAAGKGGTVSTGGVTNTGGVATGGVATGGVATGGAPGDTTPPSISAISPTNGTSGVQATTSIRIVFSEPMNQSSVSSALTVSPLKPSDLSLTWTSDGKQLTITPTGGLAYAQGTSADTTAATTYVVTIGSGAKDLAGNSLASASTSTFTTLRRITQKIAAEGVASYHSLARSYGNPPAFCSGTDTLELGHVVGLAVSYSERGFVRFDTSSMPIPSTLTALESVNFVGTQVAPTGDFYATGSILLQKLVDQAIVNTVLDAGIQTDFGTYCYNASTAQPTLAITSFFASDFNSGATHQLFSLTFSTGATDNTYANFQCGGFWLEAKYLLP